MTNLKNYKLWILGGIISLLSICSFTSADSFTLTKGSPWNILSSVQGSFSIVGDSDSFYCGSSYKSSILTYDGSYFVCGDYESSNPSNVSVANGDFNISCSSYPCSLSFRNGSFFEFLPPILSGGVSNLTPIITGLTNSVNEFIPIIAYVGIGILSALIGFFAIRRLINWVRGKSLSVFKSRKK